VRKGPCGSRAGLNSHANVVWAPAQRLSKTGWFWNCLLPVVQDQLDAAYRENLAKWVLREQVLCELLSLFVPLGTRPVLLKGFAFASQLYPDPGARQVGDIDLLIDRRWKSEVHEKLGRAGFA